MTPDTRVRYIAKPYGKHWRVYDRVLASYPVMRPEFGRPLPVFADESSCSQEADRLNSQTSVIGRIQNSATG